MCLTVLAAGQSERMTGVQGAPRLFWVKNEETFERCQRETRMDYKDPRFDTAIECSWDYKDVFAELLTDGAVRDIPPCILYPTSMDVDEPALTGSADSSDSSDSGDVRATSLPTYLSDNMHTSSPSIGSTNLTLPTFGAWQSTTAGPSTISMPGAWPTPSTAPDSTRHRPHHHSQNPFFPSSSSSHPQNPFLTHAPPLHEHPIPEFYTPDPAAPLTPDPLSDGTLIDRALHSGRLAKGQEWLPMMLRYSEKMDMGTYFVFLEGNRGCAEREGGGGGGGEGDKAGLKKGAVLLRCKPASNGRVVVWDSKMYAVCDWCKVRLVRVQVCADW
ncbi:hypothetical protein HDV00_001308 [Rhizophlyctis rosea]|nr:hypothetical protein HDV00_001308 [Rhizophlyctis rosea]